MSSTDIVSVIEGEARTTSLVIAEGVNGQHASVLRLIRDNLADLEEFGQVGFEIRPGYNNAQVQVAHLNERQTTLLLTYMRNNEVVRQFKKQLVKAFYELAQQVHGTVRRELSETEVVLQALTILKTKTEQQEQEIKVLAPKASAWDALVSSAGSWSYTDAAHALYEQKHLVIGQKRLVALLVDWAWMYRDHKGRPHAYQRVLEQGLLTEKIRTYVDTITGETLQSSAPQVRITGKGLDIIYRRLSGAVAAVAS